MASPTPSTACGTPPRCRALACACACAESEPMPSHTPSLVGGDGTATPYICCSCHRTLVVCGMRACIWTCHRMRTGLLCSLAPIAVVHACRRGYRAGGGELSSPRGFPRRLAMAAARISTGSGRRAPSSGGSISLWASRQSRRRCRRWQGPRYDGLGSTHGSGCHFARDRVAVGLEAQRC